MKAVVAVVLILVVAFILIFDLILLLLCNGRSNARHNRYKPNKPQPNPYMDLRLKHDDDEDPPDEYI